MLLVYETPSDVISSRLFLKSIIDELGVNIDFNLKAIDIRSYRLHNERCVNN